MQQSTINRIKNAANTPGNWFAVVEPLFKNLKKVGSNYECNCPVCVSGGYSISPSKMIYKCFSGCENVTGKDCIWLHSQIRGVDYPTACAQVAELLHISTDEVPEPTANDNYLTRFLAASGLTVANTAFCTVIDGQQVTVSPFIAGTLDQYGNIAPGDDVIIRYYDIAGKPVMFDKKVNGRPTGTIKPYYRARWQFPEKHKDKEGKEYKYKSPAGSGSFIYFPDKIRAAYRAQQTIETLYIQEGEKKAESACKYGLPSVAVSGITNVASDGQLSRDLVKLITTCNVNRVVMVYDSDWRDLSTKIKNGDNVALRPFLFYCAAKKFRDWFVSLKNENIYLEIYIGAIKKNAANDKGIDDLLANTLKGRETDLAADFARAINRVDLKGAHAEFYKITDAAETKIKEIWQLHNEQAFADTHREALRALKEFHIGKHLWRLNADGSLENPARLEPNEQFWIERIKNDRQGQQYIVYDFDYANAMVFLQNRGFGRLRKGKETIFVRTDTANHRVEEITIDEIRDFVRDYAETLQNKDLLNMLLRGTAQYLGPQTLSHLHYLNPIFERGTKHYQFLFFKNNVWKITRDNIDVIGYGQLDNTVWRDEIKPFVATPTTDPVVDFDYKNGVYTLTAYNKDCQFLEFLRHTSNFNWRKERDGIALTDDEKNENKMHLLSKLCAIGYLAHTYKNKSVCRAVVALDGKDNDSGESNGRSGKSLLGTLFDYITVVTQLDGKAADPTRDQFYWNDVNQKTRLVVVDDVKSNFDLEPYFSSITGALKINYKGGGRTTIPFNESPKLYITTNHAITQNGASYRDRCWFIAFSDYYNDEHRPTDDFGNLFFDDWGADQWALTMNLVAKCIQLYLRFGVVQAPTEKVKMRQLKQDMGETFYTWADLFYSKPENLNIAIDKRVLIDDYLTATKTTQFSVMRFKKQILAFCEFRGYIFNPQKLDPTTRRPLEYNADRTPNMRDYRHNVEYFTIGTPDYYKLQPATFDDIATAPAE